MGYLFFLGFPFSCVAVVLEVVRKGFVSSATKTARACRAGQREMGITTSSEQTAVGHGGRSLANTGKACTHGLTGNPGRIKRRKRNRFFFCIIKIDVLTSVGWVSYFETDQSGETYVSQFLKDLLQVG